MKNDGENLINIYLFVSENGIIKPLTNNPEVQLTYIPSKGELFWDSFTKDIYEISLVIHHDIDARILLTKIGDSEKYEVMMQ